MLPQYGEDVGRAVACRLVEAHHERGPWTSTSTSTRESGGRERDSGPTACWIARTLSRPCASSST